MFRLKFIISQIIILSVIIFCFTEKGKGQINVVPQPVSVIKNSGHFDLRDLKGYSYNSQVKNDPAWDFAQWANQNFSLKFERVSSRKSALHFVQIDTFTHKDAYLLVINEKGVEIQYKDEAGAFYATQTLKQLCPIENADADKNTRIPMKVPACIIYDYPQYGYRGMHLDESRHFFGMDAVKKYIDLLAFQKMNYFHWHLTDDQGWRIEIKKYPKLTEIGSCREQTLIGQFRSKPVRYDGKKYCYYYTQDQIKEIVNYAAKKFITIIPEIEMPGHSSAALAAYPELSCTGQQVKTAITWGVFEDVFCPKEETFLFLQNVFDEVMALFPSKYIHIGGDEVPKVQWKNCDYCQNMIKTYGLKNEEGLQSYFIGRIDKYAASKGKSIIGWDEILEGGLTVNAIVMSWRGTEGGIAAAMQNHEVIMTPGEYCYLNQSQARRPGEPVSFGGLVTLKKVYSFNPTPSQLPEDKKKYILGAQANLWSEYITSISQLQYMAYPRSFALAEVLWSPESSRNYDNFVQRLKVQLPWLDAWKVNYAHHFYSLNIHSENINNQQKVYFVTDARPPAIEYRISSGKSTTAWLPYSEPVLMPESRGVVEARIIDKSNNSESPAFSKEYEFNLGSNAKMSLEYPPSEQYNLGGINALHNGFFGTDDEWGGDEWLGFSGKDINATFKFNHVTTIRQIEMRFYDDSVNWIYPPRNFNLSCLKGNTNHENIKYKTSITEMGNIYKVTIIPDQPIDVETLRVGINRYGQIPSNARGGGNEAWLFCDEILLK